jgi:membrane associated rhomboid family serine protease
MLDGMTTSERPDGMPTSERPDGMPGAGRRLSARRVLTPERQRQSVQGLGLLMGIVAFMWLVEVINTLDGNRLDSDGIVPRDVDRLWGIFTAPFLHVSFAHLIDNTVPFLFMGVIIALRGARRLALVTLIVIVVGGLGTWLVAPGGTVLGASGVVFGYATYLFTRGLFDRSWLEILTGIVVGLVWGGALISSIVPHNGVSWQAHVCGAVGGVVAAWLLAGRWAERRGHGPRQGPGASRSHPGEGHLHDALDRAVAQ